MSWTLDRWDPYAAGLEWDYILAHDAYGFRFAGLAGGPTGELAVLGAYQLARAPRSLFGSHGYTLERPTVGVIQTFAP